MRAIKTLKYGSVAKQAAIINPKGTQYAKSAPNSSMTRPDIALAIAPPNGMPATTQVKVSVICSVGTAASATPYALMTSGATANPLKNSATESQNKEYTNNIGIDKSVSANKKIKKRAALEIFHLIAPAPIAATALPHAHIANKIPALSSWPLV